MLAHGFLEAFVAGDEVGFGVDLDERRGLAGRGDADQAFRGDAVGLLGGLEDALLAQPVGSDASMSPLFSASAFLQSIMPAPVLSRSCFDERGSDLGHLNLLDFVSARKRLGPCPKR